MGMPSPFLKITRAALWSRFAFHPQEHWTSRSDRVRFSRAPQRQHSLEVVSYGSTTSGARLALSLAFSPPMAVEWTFPPKESFLPTLHPIILKNHGWVVLEEGEKFVLNVPLSIVQLLVLPPQEIAGVLVVL